MYAETFGYRSVENIDSESCRDFDSYLPLVAAFLNNEGGVIVVNSGGCDNHDLIREIEMDLSNNLQPHSLVYVRTQNSGDKHDVVIEVPAGLEPPYAYKNVIFNVKNGVCEPATMETVREWILKGRSGYGRWENRYCMADPVEVVDSVELEMAIRDAQRRGRISTPLLAGNLVEGLTEFGVMRQGRFINAGLVMFAKRPTQVAPQTLVRLTRFAGTRKVSPIMESRTFEGPICKVIGLVTDYIVGHTPPVINFNSGDGNRNERYLYPPMAIREALVNACAHRDYESAFGGVSVLLFVDRLEIWNTGSLPEGISLRSLNAGRGVASVLVNPIISSYLYVRGYMERAGRGCALISDMVKKVGSKVEWKEQEGQVGIKFIPHRIMTHFRFVQDDGSINETINNSSERRND